MAFFIECSKCKTKSPPVVTSVPPPEGWVAVVTPAGAGSTTSWQCPTCKEPTS